VNFITLLCIFSLNMSYSQETRPISEDGLVAFKVGNNWGIKDAAGNVIVPAKYASVYNFSEDVAAVNVGGKYRTVYDKRIDPLGHSWRIPREEFYGGKWGFINSRGEEILPCIYDDAKSFSEGLAAVKLRKSWSFIDKSGAVVISGKYVSLESFSEGLAAVKLNKEYGFINKSGSLVIPCKYGEVSYFSEGLAAVATSATYTIKTKETKDYIRFYNGRKWGYIDSKGVEVIPFEYVKTGPFKNGKAEVTNFAEEVFFINMQGKKIEN